MGCDGGTIPRRDELVRVKQKPEQVRNPNRNPFTHSTNAHFPER